MKKRDLAIFAAAFFVAYTLAFVAGRLLFQAIG